MLKYAVLKKGVAANFYAFCISAICCYLHLSEHLSEPVWISLYLSASNCSQLIPDSFNRTSSLAMCFIWCDQKFQFSIWTYLFLYQFGEIVDCNCELFEPTFILISKENLYKSLSMWSTHIKKCVTDQI